MKNWNESWKICVFENEKCVIPKKSVKRKSILINGQWQKGTYRSSCK